MKKEDKNKFLKLKNLIEACNNNEKEIINWKDYYNHPFFLI